MVDTHYQNYTIISSLFGFWTNTTKNIYIYIKPIFESIDIYFVHMTIVYGMKSRDAFYVSIMELSKLFLFVESQATYNKFDGLILNG